LIQECLHDSITPISLSFAVDGEAALSVMGQVRPDVVVLDLNLPKLDGHEVLKRMKTMGEHAPVVVVLSSSRNPSDIEKVFEEGARDYITKPSNLDDFRNALNDVLRTWIDPIHQSQVQSNGQGTAVDH
jgi:CheY-like chemotaxis protein